MMMRRTHHRHHARTPTPPRRWTKNAQQIISDTQAGSKQVQQLYASLASMATLQASVGQLQAQARPNPGPPPGTQ